LVSELGAGIKEAPNLVREEIFSDTQNRASFKDAGSVVENPVTGPLPFQAY
jgi:hypothetical protein